MIFGKVSPPLHRLMVNHQAKRWKAPEGDFRRLSSFSCGIHSAAKVPDNFCHDALIHLFYCLLPIAYFSTAYCLLLSTACSELNCPTPHIIFNACQSPRCGISNSRMGVPVRRL